MAKIKDIIETCLIAQNGCNLSGIAHAMSRAITELRGIYPDKGTDFFNKHPIVTGYLDKLVQLNGFYIDDPDMKIPKIFEHLEEMKKHES